MNLRYMGFDQAQNIREYKFDCVAAGETTKHFVVSADLALFLQYHVGIQEGPSLCLHKLAAEVDGLQQSQCELTHDDLLAFVSARAAAEARKISHRKSGVHHKAAVATH